ncbi:hypothetical protein RHGRI_024048 [Rhododendron griersonianum]|uniref:Uncharacterized protein n=1 Tax=Rhododendron griersonianum TaxID=479676 RepID=A0AAV6J675_9ERIC|nr:hypothetical protein RHGRI_024048 [Rhododendron griersonianum]
MILTLVCHHNLFPSTSHCRPPPITVHHPSSTITVETLAFSTADIRSSKPQTSTVENPASKRQPSPPLATATHHRPSPTLANLRRPFSRSYQPPVICWICWIFSDILHSRNPNLQTLAQATAGHRHPPQTSGQPRSAGFFFENHWVFSCFLSLHDLEVDP